MKWNLWKKKKRIWSHIRGTQIEIFSLYRYCWGAGRGLALFVRCQQEGGRERKKKRKREQKQEEGAELRGGEWQRDRGPMIVQVSFQSSKESRQYHCISFARRVPGVFEDCAAGPQGLISCTHGFLTVSERIPTGRIQHAIPTRRLSVWVTTQLRQDADMHVWIFSGWCL